MLCSTCVSIVQHHYVGQRHPALGDELHDQIPHANAQHKPSRKPAEIARLPGLWLSRVVLAFGGTTF